MNNNYLISKGFEIINSTILYQFAIRKGIKLVKFYDDEWFLELGDKRINIDTTDKLNATLVLFGYEDTTPE